MEESEREAWNSVAWKAEERRGKHRKENAWKLKRGRKEEMARN